MSNMQMQLFTNEIKRLSLLERIFVISKQKILILVLRYRIETSICSETGNVDSTCFDEAVGVVVHVLHMKYLQKFINSHIFKNYVAGDSIDHNHFDPLFDRIEDGYSFQGLVVYTECSSNCYLLTLECCVDFGLKPIFAKDPASTKNVVF